MQISLCRLVQRVTQYSQPYPENTIHWANAGLLLVQRRRRWANINPALAQCIVFAGILSGLGYTSPVSLVFVILISYFIAHGTRISEKNIDMDCSVYRRCRTILSCIFVETEKSYCRKLNTRYMHRLSHNNDWNVDSWFCDFTIPICVL